MQVLWRIIFRMNTKIKNTVEVCLLPEIINQRQTKNPGLFVVVDIFRASSSICHALAAGVKKIIPVGYLQQAKVLKEKGYYVAGERDGVILDFADFGNSPVAFSKLIGKLPEELVMTTSNGTRTLELAGKEGETVVGCFNNFSILLDWLLHRNKNVVILCSGWLGTLSYEDTVFAGALCEGLIKSGNFAKVSDATQAALDIWVAVKDNMAEKISSGEHFRRLVKLGAEKDLLPSLNYDTAQVIPFLNKNYLVNIIKL